VVFATPNATVDVRVSDRLVAHRLRSVLGRVAPSAIGAIVVRDAGGGAGADVLVAAPSPVTCAVALREIQTARPRVLCTADEVDLVPDLLLMHLRCTVVSDRVLSLAAAMPPLDEAGLGLLRAVVDGHSYRAIGKDLGVSETSVKRRVASLAAALGVRSRYGVARVGLVLGVDLLPHERLPAAPGTSWRHEERRQG
jgi:hypothetical protein